MTIPKVISFKNPNNIDYNELDNEILGYSEKYKGYKLIENFEASMAFLGDSEDYLNASLMNYEAIRSKYDFDSKFVSFSNADTYYNNVFKGSTIFGNIKKTNQLNLMPYGIYSFTVFDGFYPGFSPIQINLDEYIKFDNSELEKLQTTVINFFKQKPIYEENKVRHKGASLLYGSPGQGKTTAINHLINSSELKDIYIIFIPKQMSFKYLEDFKKVFNGHNILIIMEEMTERLSGGTEDILNFLDGYSSWNNCYVIATTNYPEVLPPNLVDRPGRFNHLVEVKLPSDEQKVFYFKSKGFIDEEIAKVLPKTKDFSMDYIAQLVLQSKLQKLPLEECLKVLEDNKKKVKSSFRGKSGISL